MKSPSSCAIWNPTKDFFESLDLAEISHLIPGSTVKGHKYPSNSSKMHEIFTPVVYNVNCENSKGARLVKDGEIGKKRNNQTSIHTRVRKKLHSFWKKRNKTCLCFDTPFFQSFNINFKVRSQKNGHFFLFCFWKLIFCSHESKRCWTVHRDQRINCDTVALRAKQSGAVKTVEHSKNDYHKSSKQASKDWHSGDFDVKWGLY